MDTVTKTLNNEYTQRHIVDVHAITTTIPRFIFVLIYVVIIIPSDNVSWVSYV
jgi:hypothetical protein